MIKGKKLRSINKVTVFSVFIGAVLTDLALDLGSSFVSTRVVIDGCPFDLFRARGVIQSGGVPSGDFT